jgi:hypothetical protein
MVVGTTSAGVTDLNSVLKQMSREYGLWVKDGNYVLAKIADGLGKSLGHVATTFDIDYMCAKKGIPAIPCKISMEAYFDDEGLQSALDSYISESSCGALLKYNSKGFLYLWHYDVKRCLLLFDILNAMVNDFYIQMNDHMSRDDYAKSSEYNRTIRVKTKEYEEKYGKLPNFSSIDTVMDLKSEMSYLLSEKKSKVVPNTGLLGTLYSS